MTDRSNTIFGWILAAGIVALMLKFIFSLIIPEAHRPEQLGYVIEGAEEEGAEEGPDLATLLASGDAAAGANVFAKCTACHTINQGGANGIGPNLYHVVGEAIGEGRGGFAFSSDLANHGGVWDYENLDAWLKSPRGFAAGTKMSFAGLSNPQDRANVILYLLENGGGPPLPTPAPAEEEAPAEGADAVEPAPDAEGADAAGAMTETPVAEQNAATGNAGQ